MTKWVTKKLGEGLVKSICTGKLDANALVEGGAYRFYTCAKNYSFIDEYAFDDEALLISGNGEYVGYVHYYKGKFNAYQRTYVLRNFSIDIHFLQCYLNYFLRDRIKKEMNAGSIPFIKMGTLTEMPITYPESLAEQRRIAGILSSADGAIAASEALIAKYRNIKRGLLTTLLQPKEGWKKVKLGECCEVNPKTDLSVLHSNDEIAFLKMEDVSNDGKITNCNYLKYCFLAKKGFTTFQNEDVIFAKITPCMENGKGALIRNIKSIVGMGSTEFHVLRAKENISIDFIYQISISKHFRLEAEMQMTGSAGQQRVPTAFLEEYEISVPYKNGQPDLTEQRRIADILSSVDAKIAAEEKVVEKYKGVKKGLMEELLKSNNENN